jgi:hypothetical protein
MKIDFYGKKAKAKTNLDLFLRVHVTSTSFFIIETSHSYHELLPVMGVRGKRVHIIEELSETVISFQKGNKKEE